MPNVVFFGMESVVTPNVIMPNVVMPNVAFLLLCRMLHSYFYPVSLSRMPLCKMTHFDYYAICRYAECRGAFECDIQSTSYL